MAVSIDNNDIILDRDEYPGYEVIGELCTNPETGEWEIHFYNDGEISVDLLRKIMRAIEENEMLVRIAHTLDYLVHFEVIHCIHRSTGVS